MKKIILLVCCMMFFSITASKADAKVDMIKGCWRYQYGAIKGEQEIGDNYIKNLKNGDKYELILDSLQKLLKSRNLQTISVSEIAQAAGIGKGSIYYYFPSKDAILDALVERNYEKPLTTAKKLSAQTEIPPFTRMAPVSESVIAFWA